MIRRRKEDGFTLIELMIVIAIVGVLAFPEIEQIRTSAKLTGVQANYRSVITTIYGLQSKDDVVAELTSVFGDSRIPEVEDMTNPITDKTGVATTIAYDNEPPPAVYVVAEAMTTLPSGVKQLKYKGTVVVVIQADNSVVVYGCDEVGKLMPSLKLSIRL